MFYLGIDIGKRNHEVGLINHAGDLVGKTLRFKSTKAGSDQLLKFINQHQLTPDDVAVGMEVTGYYRLSVFSFLKHLVNKNLLWRCITENYVPEARHMV